MGDNSSIPGVHSKITQQFPNSARVDDRPGFKGIIIIAEDLLNILEWVNQELHYDYLSSITAVDDFPEDQMEVVYHLFKSVGGQEIELKVMTDRESPKVPSAVYIYPGAELQEREVYDLFGVNFLNHPDLRRILMWEGFEGYPLRKGLERTFL